MDQKKDKFDFGGWIEKNRMIIGLVLLILIIVGGGFLLWRENYWKPGLESRIENYESRLTTQDQKIKVLEDKLGQSAVSSSADPDKLIEASSTNPDNQGQVAGTATNNQKAEVSGKVNINTGTVAELDSLSGIGPVYAGRIIEYRQAHGGFKSLEEIMNVKGIGQITFNKFKDKISL